MPTTYPVGARATFADATATTSKGEPGVAHGVINGPPITDDEGAVTHIPVWCQRDNGREATTVYVATANVLSVEP